MRAGVAPQRDHWLLSSLRVGGWEGLLRGVPTDLAIMAFCLRVEKGPRKKVREKKQHNFLKP